MAKTCAAATIAAGESLSAPVDLTSSRVALMISPAEWTDAEITVQVSADGETYCDLFDAHGYELRRTVVPNAATIFVPAFTQGAVFMKIRSGSRVEPIAQEAERVFTLVLI